jgi:hypothetical protein
MNPQGVFCANAACADRGVTDKGHIKVHSHKERRFRCLSCNQTFAATSGTPFYRLHKEQSLFVGVITLLVHGCPLPARGAAFGLDERTVADWQRKAGGHCPPVHHHHLDTKKVDRQPVPADERYAKRQGGRSWMALAMAVPSRRWRGGAVRPVRNLDRIQRFVDRVRLAGRPGTALRIGVAGLSRSVGAFGAAFRQKVMPGQRGRPPYRLPEGIWLAQVIKSYSGRRLRDVVRRVLWGSAEQVLGQLARTGTGQQINTSYIERLNATFRACLAGLTRRGRRLLKDEAGLQKGMYLVGCVYNFCNPHRSLRLQQKQGKKWLQCTPAMAAGWTDHVWTLRELLSFRVLHA